MHNRLWHSLSEFDVESYTVYAYFVKRLLLKGGSLFTLIFYVCGVGLGVRRPPNTLYDNRRTMCMTAVVPPVCRSSNNLHIAIKAIALCLNCSRKMIQTSCF